MSNYGSLDKKIQKCMCNTSRDIICYFSTVANEDHVYKSVTIVLGLNYEEYA